MCRTLLRRLSASRKLLGLSSAVMIARAISTPSMVSSFLNAFMLSFVRRPASGCWRRSALRAAARPRSRPRLSTSARWHSAAISSASELETMTPLPSAASLRTTSCTSRLARMSRPARRLVQQQHRRRPRHPLRQHDLLLVAARQHRRRAAAADAELLHVRRRDRLLVLEQEPLSFGSAMLRSTSMSRISPCDARSSGTSARPARIARRGRIDADRLALDLDQQVVGLAPGAAAEQADQHAGAARAHQPGQAQDLARVQVERHAAAHRQHDLGLDRRRRLDVRRIHAPRAGQELDQALARRLLASTPPRPSGRRAGRRCGR